MGLSRRSTFTLTGWAFGSRHLGICVAGVRHAIPAGLLALLLLGTDSLSRGRTRRRPVSLVDDRPFDAVYLKNMPRIRGMLAIHFPVFLTQILLERVVQLADVVPSLCVAPEGLPKLL